jgi:hypothetical protein
LAFLGIKPCSFDPLQFGSRREELLGLGLAKQGSLCKLQYGLTWCQNRQGWWHVWFFLLQFWFNGFIVLTCRVRHSFSLHGSSLVNNAPEKIFTGIRLPLRSGLQRSGLILLLLRNKKGLPWRRYQRSTREAENCERHFCLRAYLTGSVFHQKENQPCADISACDTR